MKRLVVICLLFFLFVEAKAQTFANGWIDYSQKYYKIKIAQNGIYRIDSATLANAGIPVGFGAGAINPQNLQIFNKGKQQYIYVEGENDGVFNSSDFIEFYGEKNDGVLDTSLYVYTQFIPNPYYSLINDTAVYFLTWNPNAFANNRLLTETDINFNSFPDSSYYFFKDEVQEYHNGYLQGETDFVGGTDVHYTRAEGWFETDGWGDPTLLLGTQVPKQVSTKNVYSSGPNAIIKTVVVGESRDPSFYPNDHHIKIEYSNNNNNYSSITTPLSGLIFKGYEPQLVTYNLNPSLLGQGINGTTYFRFISDNIGAPFMNPNLTDNRTAISYINIKYPHRPNLEGSNNFLMYVPNAPNGQLKSHYFFTNFNTSTTVRLYDLSNSKRITVVPSGGNFEALIPNSFNGTEKKCYITSDGDITNVTSLIPVTPSAQFTDFGATPVDSAYIIVTHKLLMPSIMAANGYKNYRSGSSGGSQNVVVADIDELYDQFAYGIVQSPLSIRGFCDFMIYHNPLFPPQNLFLIGKSYRVSYTRQNGTTYANCLVPSFGNPASDLLLTAGLTPLLANTIIPAIPTGRLSAQTPTQVDDYLNKVKDFENQNNQNGDWKKQVLHFGGGSNAGEQGMFKYYLNSYKKTIDSVRFGGNVKSFWKNTNAPIQINTSDTLRDLINNGVSLMTFFGHASGQSFDQSLDDINTYSPAAGRFPFLLANSCYAGDIHAWESSSESFVLTANKGMIGYLGSVSLGVPVYLNIYSSEFYSQLSKISYGKGIGRIIQKTISSISLASNDSLRRNTCLEMTLHGDPAVKICPGTKPDFKITGNDVYFDAVSVPDYVIVTVARTNIGEATNDTTATHIIRTFPDGTTDTKIIFNSGPYYKDTVKFKFKVDTINTSGAGLNKFYVTLDRNSNVNELDENNNTTGEVDYIITGGDIIPVYPYEYAIVPTDTVTLKANTANLLAASKNYIFQMDTTDTFNSTFLQTTTITSVGGVVKWKPQNFLTTDSTVYYWRVSPDSISPTSGYKWRESSFQHINNKKGWEQAHFFQFKKNEYQFVHFMRPQRKFEFFNDLKTIEGTTLNPYWQTEYKINGYVTYREPWVAGITFAIIDPISGIPRVTTDLGNGYGTVGNITWGPLGWHETAFDFYQDDSTQRAVIANFIANDSVVHPGDYVLALSGENTIPQWGAGSPLINAFHTYLGATAIDTVPANRPYILFGKKGGGPGLPTEIIGASTYSIINSSNTILTNWTQGYIKSPIIGPASAWHSMHWKWRTQDGAATRDSIVVNIIGITATGQENVLAVIPANMLDVLNLGNIVPVSTYQNIRLIAYMKDDSLHSAPQLQRWHVVYDPVPECAINPAVGGVQLISNETVQEGDNFTVRLPIQNIGSIPFPHDSLIVSAWVVDANGVTHHFPDKIKKRHFAPNDVIYDTISVNTYDTIRFRGNNALWVEANPINKPPYSQLEQYHFNNIIRIPFTVSGDRVNPLLDVTFDGVHILNSDIVSAKPNILMKLKDENQFLALNDTNDFKVFLQTPASGVAKRIWFGSTMTFVPAVLPNNSCRINYTPVFPQDGTYQLIVQAKDVSSNMSGATDYKINFEIVNKATITEVMNYPNPFTTSTRFVFTLTGSELPSNFKIQIMTITGKVVKEIFQEELGFIHVGRNITEYAWDGRDEYGDRLANGVYLYRVITKLNGEDIERRETEADQYFKKGWGKMYLMR